MDFNPGFRLGMRMMAERMDENDGNIREVTDHGYLDIISAPAARPKRPARPSQTRQRPDEPVTAPESSTDLGAKE